MPETSRARQLPTAPPGPNRVRPPPPATTTTTTTTTTAAGAAAASSSAGGVRRNLFKSQLTRRPTPSSSTSAETLRLDTCVDVLSDSDEIVVRNKQGEPELYEAARSSPIGEGDEDAVDEKEEIEKTRRRLAQAVKHYQVRGHCTLPEERDALLEAVKGSLRAAVVALADDNWMFEAEPLPRH